MKKSALKEFIRNQIISELSLLEQEEEAKTAEDQNKKNEETKEDLARIEKEMRTLARDYSKAEGIEKEKLLNILRDKTKIKKELVKLLDRV